MVLDERDAVDLDVVDLGSELDALVLLAAHYRTDIRTVSCLSITYNIKPEIIL